MPFPMNICTPCPYGKLKDFLENNFPFKNIEGGSGIQHTIISIFFSPRIDFFKNNLLCILLCQHMNHYLSAKEVFFCLTGRTKHLESGVCLPLWQDLGLVV